MGHAISTDAELIEASVAGRVDAFTALVERYQSLVCAVSYSATGDRALSEDVAQETFVAAWNGLEELRERDKLRGWLCGIARNLSSKALRRFGREIPSDTEVQAAINEVASAPSVLDDALDKESEQLVWTALHSIPETYREPLVLFYREDRSTKQVAESLGLSEDAVQQRLSRGRQYLKASVADLVERTLERTKPSKGFAAAVVAAISVSAIGTAKAAAQATSNASSSAGGPFAFAKGHWTMKTLKIAALVTTIVLLIFAGTALRSRASGLASTSSKDQAHVTASGPAAFGAGSALGPNAHPSGSVGSSSHGGSAGLRSPRPGHAEVVFSFSFSDADKQHSKELEDAIMPKAHETMDILADCYDAFLERQPSLRGSAGEVTVDVDVTKDSTGAGFAVDSHYRAHPATKTDAEFDECMRESSFAVDFQADQGNLTQGTVRIRMDFLDRAKSGENLQAATRACFDDLKRRRPDVETSGTIHDATFAACMDRAVGTPEATNPDVAACLEDARRRLPNASREEIAKDATSCLNNKLAGQRGTHPTIGN
jgi:RNA polymerase sigma factor (sigma-70 family)